MVTGLTKQQDAKLNAQLDKWQQDLVNLTKRNKLLHFRHTKTSSLEVVAPSLAQVAARLDGAGWSFYVPSTSEDDEDNVRGRFPNELETSKRNGKDVLASLRSLERTSNQTMLDTGLWVLYMAFGMLRWVDPADDSVSESPLLLRPVVLHRPGQPMDFTLKASDDDPIINPALTIKLANDFGITLPTIEDVEGTADSVIDAVRRAVSKQKSWEIEDRVVLTTFTFHKEAMYRDLLVNRQTIASHPLVQLAAVGPEAGADRFSFAPPSDEELDTVAPPEGLVSIRDADSTQRKCIVAAREGRSFVMDGPPGTGKSQTITNIIAELLNEGRSVLFVSEKAAALEVVSKRLSEAGLSEFVLELHSHKATRKEVAAELGRSLEVSPRARASFNETDRANLLRIRQELNNYAISVNVIRSPLGQSLYQVLGRIVQLQTLPQAPVANAIDTSMTPDALGGLVGTAERLGRAWRPVLDGDAFLWRSLRDTKFTASRQQEIQRLLGECASALDRVQRQLEEVDANTGLGWTATLEDAHRTQNMLTAVEGHPRRSDLPTSWLSIEDLSSLKGTAATRQRQVDDLAVALGEAQRVAGDQWRATPQGRSSEVQAALSLLGAGALSLTIDDSASVATLKGIGQLWIDIDKRVAALGDDARTVADAFGVEPGTLTLDRCGQLAELTSFVGSATPPEPAWLTPFAQAALVEAVSVLKELIADYRRRRAALANTFTDGVLDLDLVALRTRLAASSGMRKLGGTYRADKKTLSACVVGGKVTPAVVEQLGEAIAWRDLRTRLLSAESTHLTLLGGYYQGPMNTDLDRLDRALHIAHRAVELCGGRVSVELSGQLALGAQPSVLAVDAGTRLAAALEAWQLEVVPRLTAMGPNAPSADLDTLVDWCTAARPGLDRLLDATSSVSRGVGKELMVLDAVAMLTLADQISDDESALAATHNEDAALLGPTWAGLATDFEQLGRDVAWAESVVAAAGGPLDEQSAAALIVLDPEAEPLAERLSEVAKVWATIADLFSQPWRDRISADFGVSFESGRTLLEEMHATIGDIEEWTRYVGARQELVDSGLGDVVAFLEATVVPSDQVAPIVERSILECWADKTIDSDERLKTLSPTERDKLVEHFRQLDRSLVANAAASVINACTERRPATTLGAAGIIRREAQKKTRHKPIRTLLEETKEVSHALKPCFMMSPLSVSQYLPADVAFDVVIFDEASQVKPADAVNCIYRGRQLIVAGDPRQLPPTNFFEQVAEEGTDEYDDEAPEDFESVLDIFLGSGLPPLSLQWHYRSQHESLITYSNYRFYDGKLHTFPGAVELADDVGVELIQANGVYRRGGSRDNPIEAAKVVERVLFHRRNHPDLTLGVVAFSSSQESAIVAELERRREEAPEIVELLAGDNRLDGFFVKNLENVQGDERDIVIFSIGYGPDENGKFTEQLGPLGQKGGERRLNVAITRARRRVEVVASITAGHFPGTSSAPGIRHLQRYLDFADRGVSALALDVVQGGGDAESVFEEAVLEYIASLGHVAVPQVGVAGYRLDIGIRHPGRPGEFVLGVECDGAAYHSSRVARDRDRLRQEILEGLGWRMHRIWGPSWFRDRRGQEDALKAAIADAIEGRSPQPKAKPTATPRPMIEIETVDLNAHPGWSDEYEVSPWSPRGWYEASEVHAVPTSELVVGIDRIVRDEGPIHEELLRRRLAEAYGVRRIGDRIKTSFDRAIATALRQKAIERTEKLFLQSPGTEPAVRTANEDDERSKRTVIQVPPSERQLAIENLVLDSHRVGKDDLLVAFGRLFGWRRVGLDIDSAFERDLASLVKAGRVNLDGRGTAVAP